MSNLFCDNYTIKTYQTNCILKSTCKDKNCVEFCRKCYLMNLYLIESNIPTQYIKTPIKKLISGPDLKVEQALTIIKSNIVDFVQAGGNLLLRSAIPGNGKTLWACKLAMNYFKDCNYDVISTKGLFVNVTDFINKGRANINNPNSEFNQLSKTMYECDLLILDDIGTQKLTDYQYALIYDIVNTRINNKKSIIFTTNGNNETLTQNLDVRLLSRIVETSRVLEFVGPSKRKANW